MISKLQKLLSVLDFFRAEKVMEMWRLPSIFKIYILLVVYITTEVTVYLKCNRSSRTYKQAMSTIINGSVSMRCRQKRYQKRRDWGRIKQVDSEMV